MVLLLKIELFLKINEILKNILASCWFKYLLKVYKYSFVQGEPTVNLGGGVQGVQGVQGGQGVHSVESVQPRGLDNNPLQHLSKFYFKYILIHFSKILILFYQL